MIFFVNIRSINVTFVNTSYISLSAYKTIFDCFLKGNLGTLPNFNTKGFPSVRCIYDPQPEMRKHFWLGQYPHQSLCSFNISFAYASFLFPWAHWLLNIIFKYPLKEDSFYRNSANGSYKKLLLLQSQH